MSNLSECPNPNCNRKAEKAVSSNYFTVHTCLKCKEKYCDECSEDGNCLHCGSSEYADYDKVYAE
jgi:hypothetical protein